MADDSTYDMLVRLGLDASQAADTIDRLGKQADDLRQKIKAVADAFNVDVATAARVVAEQELPKLEVGAGGSEKVAEFKASLSQAVKDIQQDQSLAYKTQAESTKNELNLALEANKQKRADAATTAKAEISAEQARANAAKGIVNEINKLEKDRQALQQKSEKLTQQIAASEQKSADQQLKAREKLLQGIDKEKAAKEELARKAAAESGQALAPTNLTKATSELSTLRNETAKTKAEILDFMKTNSVSAAEAAESIKRAFKTENFGNAAAIKQKNKAISDGLKEINREAKAAQPQINKFGSILKNAFALAGIYSAIQLIRQGIQSLISGFKELVTIGEEYAQTIYRTGVAVNQLQRRGANITIQKEIDLIKELSGAYDVYSQKSIMEALTNVQLLTRNFGFTEEQIRKTTELSLDLALVQGRDVAETAKQLALFYSSGYGEGLQRAGIAVNRLTVAQEAQREGIDKSYMALTEVERATAGYNLVTRQTADLHQDAVKVQGMIIGQLKEQKSGIENVTNEIALRSLPVELAWLKVKRASIEALMDWITWDKLYKDALAEEKGRPFTWWKDAFTLDKGAAAKADEAIKKQKEEWEKLLSGTLDVETDLSLDLSGGDQELANARQELGDKIIKLYDDLMEAQADYDEESVELERDHADKIAEINTELVNKLKDLWADYQDELVDIQKDLDKAIAEAQLNYQRDLADINREERQSIEDSNRKHRENELKAERDFQERMRRLREEFLFDLQEALRQRDALQVLQLMKRYQLDVEQEKRGYESQREEEDRQHQLELEDIRRQAEEKRRAAYESLQQEIADAQAAAEEKRAEALANYQQEIIDAQENAQKARDQEKADYEARKAELAQQLLDRQNDLLNAFGIEVGITGMSLETVKQLFTKYFGAKGEIPTVIDGYIAKINEMAIKTSDNIAIMEGALAELAAATAANVTSINTSLNALDWSKLSAMQQINRPPQTELAPGNLNPVPNGTWRGGHASGAKNLILTRPQYITAGEVPERVDITPLNQLGSQRGNGRGTLEIHLGDGLVANIIDNTLDQFDIVLRQEMSKK